MMPIASRMIRELGRDTKDIRRHPLEEILLPSLELNGLTRIKTKERRT